MNKLADQRVLFLHVPKTGGTTLRSIVARQYADGELYDVANPINENIVAFRNLSRIERSRYRAIQGHMSFGLHTLMQPPLTYITMLRDPIRRTISDYAFVSSNTLHPLYEQVRKMSLRDYVSSGLTGQLENGQTRLLSGDAETGDPGIPTLRPMTAADRDIAIDNLNEHFAVVGLLERFDESLVLMQHALGWQLPVYVRENVTDRRAKPTLTDADLDTIAQHNAHDIAVYDAAVARFEQQLSDYAGDFAADLAALQRANRTFAMRQNLTWRQIRPRLGRMRRRLLGQ